MCTDGIMATYSDVAVWVGEYSIEQIGVAYMYVSVEWTVITGQQTVALLTLHATQFTLLTHCCDVYLAIESLFQVFPTVESTWKGRALDTNPYMFFPM